MEREKVAKRVSNLLQEIRKLREEVDIPAVAVPLRNMETECYWAAVYLEVEDGIAPEVVEA